MKDYNAVGFSTIEQIGLGFRPFIHCEDSDQSFHVALFLSNNPLKIVAAFPRMRLGKRISPEIVCNRSARRAVLRSDEEILYTIDGDMHRSVNHELIVEAGPRIEIILR